MRPQVPSNRRGSGYPLDESEIAEGGLSFGVDPAYHPEIFGNPAVARSYGFVRSRDGVQAAPHDNSTFVTVALVATQSPPMSSFPAKEEAIEAAKTVVTTSAVKAIFAFMAFSSLLTL